MTVVYSVNQSLLPCVEKEVVRAREREILGGAGARTREDIATAVAGCVVAARSLLTNNAKLIRAVKRQGAHVRRPTGLHL